MADDTLLYRLRSTVTGVILFILIVAGGTYYLQSSLILVKLYDPYTHWAVVLIALPALAGLVLRFMNVWQPILATVFGALASAALLYPQYKSLWAEPPSMMDVSIYIAIVLGIGFFATQPLKTTFMMAFRLGRFSLPVRTSPDKKKASSRKPKMTTSQRIQRLQSTGHANVVAMLELLVGLTSLALSIFSIFFLGKG